MSAPWQRVAGATPPAPVTQAPEAPLPPPSAAAEETAPEVPEELVGLAAAVADLDRLGEVPVGEHVAAYDALHGRLSDSLASIDGV